VGGIEGGREMAAAYGKKWKMEKREKRKKHKYMFFLVYTTRIHT
jgi:hypothetical protein